MGLLDQQNSFLGKVLLHVAVFGILLIRTSSDLDKYKGLIDEATFYDKQVRPGCAYVSLAPSLKCPANLYLLSLTIFTLSLPMAAVERDVGGPGAAQRVSWMTAAAAAGAPFCASTAGRHHRQQQQQQRHT